MPLVKFTPLTRVIALLTLPKADAALVPLVSLKTYASIANVRPLSATVPAARLIASCDPDAL
jgi:hypothetical protein